MIDWNTENWPASTSNRRFSEIHRLRYHQENKLLHVLLQNSIHFRNVWFTQWLTSSHLQNTSLRSSRGFLIQYKNSRHWKSVFCRSIPKYRFLYRYWKTSSGYTYRSCKCTFHQYSHILKVNFRRERYWSMKLPATFNTELLVCRSSHISQWNIYGI